MCQFNPRDESKMYGCRTCDYDLCDNCYMNGIEDNNNIPKAIIFSLFPNLKYITLVTTRFKSGKYYQYPINISYLIQSLPTNSKKVTITIRGCHNYKIKLDEETKLIGSRDHISSSWIHCEWLKLSSEYKKQYNMSFHQPYVRDLHGRMMLDVLCIEC